MDYINQYLALIDGIKIISILVLISVDFILGVMVAVKEKTFQLSRIGNFLNTSVLYFLGGYLVLGVAAVAEPSIGNGVITGAWALLLATMAGYIFDKAKKLGINVPEKLT